MNGRYDFSYSDKTLFESINNLFVTLPDETLIYPGHGDPSTLGAEQTSILSLPSSTC